MALNTNNIHPPKTLQEWRDQKNQPGAYPRNMWTPLESFFASQGYSLWKPWSNCWNVKPPNDVPRALDPFAFRTPYNDMTPDAPMFSLVNAIHCPARTADNRDVLIRLMAIGDNRGEKHLTALARLRSNNVLKGPNHTVPVLQEIVCNDMTFAVFPLMDIGFSSPWYYTFSEVFDAVAQILEGINFCHERLVAHRDIDSDNILINWVGGRNQAPESFTNGHVTPFRSYFPIRYYITDFELAATFDFNSPPSSRVVTGLPTTGVRRGEYGRNPAPEMLSGVQYCPFRADIWQLGVMFNEHFGHLGHLSKSLVELFYSMQSTNPNSRPSASEALECVQQIHQSLNPQMLLSAVPQMS